MSEMKLKNYVYLWLCLTAVLGFEYLIADAYPSLSLLRSWQRLTQSEFNISKEPGRPISLILGWTGLGLMLTTNLYILRKRWSRLHNVGRLPGWLNFHIFCGMMGPTCIVFHSFGKVGGLVAISYWSMLIVAFSGVVGRYIYVQIARQEASSNKVAKHWTEKLVQMQKNAAKEITDEVLERLKLSALQYVGVPAGAAQSNLFLVLTSSFIGDVRRYINLPPTVSGLPEKSRIVLEEYALAERRAILLEPFKRLLGHWHSFHLPFAFFMYTAAVIHVIAALIFGT